MNNQDPIVEPDNVQPETIQSDTRGQGIRGSQGAGRIVDPEWSLAETILLIDTYSKYFYDIEFARTKADENAKFELLANDFHRENVGGTTRDDQQLKTKWKSLIDNFREKYNYHGDIGPETTSSLLIEEKIFNIVKNFATFFPPVVFSSISNEFKTRPKNFEALRATITGNARNTNAESILSSSSMVSEDQSSINGNMGTEDGSSDDEQDQPRTTRRRLNTSIRLTASPSSVTLDPYPPSQHTQDRTVSEILPLPSTDEQHIENSMVRILDRVNQTEMTERDNHFRSFLEYSRENNAALLARSDRMAELFAQSIRETTRLTDAILLDLANRRQQDRSDTN